MDSRLLDSKQKVDHATNVNHTQVKPSSQMAKHTPSTVPNKVVPNSVLGKVPGKVAPNKIATNKVVTNKVATNKVAPSLQAVVIIGGGPSGLMAAECIATAGHRVVVYDAMPSVGRKFLLAGVGGMNITHSEPMDMFKSRYGDALTHLSASLDAFDNNALSQWTRELGIDTFVGSSGRVFPVHMKAAPLLRAWLRRLRRMGVTFMPRHRWQGWNEQSDLIFLTPEGTSIRPHSSTKATVLALGGGSWRRLGSDGAWRAPLVDKNICVTPLQPSNCGFNVDWSELIREKFAGAQLGTAIFSVDAKHAGKPHDQPVQLNKRHGAHRIRGEAIVSKYGIEGTSIYALSARLREHINNKGVAYLYIDLLPDYSIDKVQSLLNKPRGKNSLSNCLRKRFKLSPLKIALVYEMAQKSDLNDSYQLARLLTCLPIVLHSTRPIDEAISTAGGVAFSELNDKLMLKALPGVFCSGEMLDWEAPTGGYLLTACMSTGMTAGKGVLHYLSQ